VSRARASASAAAWRGAGGPTPSPGEVDQTMRARGDSLTHKHVLTPADPMTSAVSAAPHDGTVMTVASVAVDHDSPQAMTVPPNRVGHDGGLERRRGRVRS
jgi:hypothetical protein